MFEILATVCMLSSGVVTDTCQTLVYDGVTFETADVCEMELTPTSPVVTGLNEMLSDDGVQTGVITELSCQPHDDPAA